MTEIHCAPQETYASCARKIHKILNQIKDIDPKAEILKILANGKQKRFIPSLRMLDTWVTRYKRYGFIWEPTKRNRQGSFQPRHDVWLKFIVETQNWLYLDEIVDQLANLTHTLTRRKQSMKD